MAKTTNNTHVFRLQDIEGQHGLNNTIQDWGISRMYTHNQINDIASSNANSLSEPTSIPSPFARIALAKEAFKEVAENGEKALASYQKIVSDSLDVGEIFFTYEKWRDKVDIIEWKYGRQGHSKDLTDDSDLKKMKQGHHQLYKTLKAFLENDAEFYNFDILESLYILKDKTTAKMIGATSPATMFFSSANNLEDVDIQLSTDRKAFRDIIPLHKRGWDYQKFLYTWMAANNENRLTKSGTAISIFSEFFKYLETEKIKINKNQEIDALFHSPASILDSAYKPIQAPDVEIVGKQLYQIKDYGIDSLNNDDILEDSIFRLSGRINSKSFFGGNLNDNAKYSYLLPLKDETFKHFALTDLQDNKTFKISEVSDNFVVATLISSSGKKFEKKYKVRKSIIDLDNFDCILFPNIKFNDEKEAFYRFGVFSNYNPSQRKKRTVEFYKKNTKIALNNNDIITRNTSDNQNSVCDIYSLNQQIFDRVKVNDGYFDGVLLPTLPSKGNAEQFIFAVDFGTTNTHIEYKTNNGHNIKPFDIEESEQQVEFLIGKNDAYNIVADIDFIPKTVGGENKEFKFPIRTALSVVKQKKENQKVNPFTGANVVIPYEKRKIPGYNDILTQLKWESNEDEIKYFIDSLCYMLRNKVVINGGDLSATKLSWFYPLSMAGSRSKVIENIWKVSYAKYFLGENVNNFVDLQEETKRLLNKRLSYLPESVAPYLYYKDHKDYKDAINNLISIDIGGGTSDIVFVQDQVVKFVTSFRFAANSIFGLGEHSTPVVSKYQAEIEKIIKSNDDNFQLETLYESITNTDNGDIASFFFSLSEHKMMQNADFSFNSILQRDSSQKLVFILFYTAIIYHTAHIIKAKKLPLPRHITFSGNGSRLLTIVGEIEVLEELSKAIFEQVCEKNFSEGGLSIIHNTQTPKEVTCKGGIKAANNDYVQPQFNPIVLLGTDSNTFVKENDTYADIDIEEYSEKAKTEAKKFISFVIEDLLYKKYTKGVVPESFLKALSLDSQTLYIARNVLKNDDDLKTFTINSVRRKLEKDDAYTTQIEESFFFYPIAGFMKALSIEIKKQN